MQTRCEGKSIGKEIASVFAVEVGLKKLGEYIGGVVFAFNASDSHLVVQVVLAKSVVTYINGSYINGSRMFIHRWLSCYMLSSLGIRVKMVSML